MLMIVKYSPLEISSFMWSHMGQQSDQPMMILSDQCFKFDLSSGFLNTYWQPLPQFGSPIKGFILYLT